MKRMRKLRRHAPVALALILASLSSSCGTLLGLIGRNRTLKHNGKPVTAKQMLLEATRDQLSERVASLYNPINSFQADVIMTPSSGSVYKGQIKEIADVPAIIIFRKPVDIRILVRAPLVGSEVVDMVSNGTEFSMFLSRENKFIHGLNAAPATSKSKIENLRPAAFLSSMTIMPTQPGETPVLMDLTDEDNALYVLEFIRKLPSGDLWIGRTVWFDRLDLSIVRQMVFDESGSIVSDTHYTSPWSTYNGVLFPSHIDIQRPKEEYGVVMDIKSMQMNKALSDKQFVLTRPEGSTLQEIGAPAATPPAKPEPR
jgi:outer membrane lipoprotein-sorting protein